MISTMVMSNPFLWVMVMTHLWLICSESCQKMHESWLGQKWWHIRKKIIK